MHCACCIVLQAIVFSCIANLSQVTFLTRVLHADCFHPFSYSAWILLLILLVSGGL